MSKATRTSNRDSSHLAADILKSLAETPRQTAGQLAETFGFNPSTVRVRLGEMLDTGKINFIKDTGRTAAARKVKQWFVVGESSPTVAADPDVRRNITCNFPRGQQQRDPLVSALFGPAGAKP